MFVTGGEPSCAQRTTLSTIELSVNLAELMRRPTPSILRMYIAWFQAMALRKARSLEVA